MAEIIRNSFTVTTHYQLTGPVQLAPGAVISVAPGGVLDLGGHSLHVFGKLELQGSSASLAQIRGGVVTTAEAEGEIVSDFGQWTNVSYDDFFARGSWHATNSVFDSSSIAVTPGSAFETVLFRNTSVDLDASDQASFRYATFVDSPLLSIGWVDGGNELSHVNFVGQGDLLVLSSFFPFPHWLDIENAYIEGTSPNDVDTRIVDSDDDLLIQTDIRPESFNSTPFTNDPLGFRVGPELVQFANPALPSFDLGLSGITASQQKFLTAVYVGSFSRAPDHAGIAYWADDLAHHLQAGLSEDGAFRLLAEAMYNAGVANGEHGSSMELAEYVTYLYNNVLGRAPDSAGHAYWVNDLQSGVVSRGQFISTFLTAALGHESDAAFLNARIAVAEFAAQQHVSGPEASHIDLEAVLAGVTDNASALRRIEELAEQYPTLNAYGFAAPIAEAEDYGFDVEVGLLGLTEGVEVF